MRFLFALVVVGCCLQLALCGKSDSKVPEQSGGPVGPPVVNSGPEGSHSDSHSGPGSYSYSYSNKEKRWCLFSCSGEPGAPGNDKGDGAGAPGKPGSK